MADAKKLRSEASTSGGPSGASVVIDYGRRKSTCGYCKSGARTSISHGLWANSLTVDHYQALLDRGWRRSGCFLYKPEMEKTCCPSYTIRLKASDFVPSKEQVRVSRKMQRFLDGTLDVKKSDMIIDELSTVGPSCGDEHDRPATSTAIKSSVVDSEDKKKLDQATQTLSDLVDQLVQFCLQSGELPHIQFPKASVKKVAPAKRKLQADLSEDLIYTCNISFQVAATLQRTRKNVEQGGGGKIDLVEISPQNIAEIIVKHSDRISEPCGFSIRACNGHINFYHAGQGQLVEKAEKRSMSKPVLVEHTGNKKSSTEKCGGIKGQRRRFEIRLKQSSFDLEEYALYKKYQLQVHNDTPDHVTESSYKRFLVDTPLIHVSPADGVTAPPCGFGSFHQQYVVDGKLIAVGIIDILPKCLSSKYLFWDPDLAFLSLGKYSALEEIRWVNENQVHCPSLQYYYLGYYIHSCRKMRYKAAYRPSELLCPLRYQWVSYDVAKQLLDRNKYVALSDFTALQNDSMLVNAIKDNMEEQQNEFMQEASNDDFVNDDEMAELEDSEDESDSEDTGAIMELEEAELGSVLIKLHGTLLRYKDIRYAFDSTQRKLFESQLQRYARVVGTELVGQMVYSLE